MRGSHPTLLSCGHRRVFCLPRPRRETSGPDRCRLSARESQTCLRLAQASPALPQAGLAQAHPALAQAGLAQSSLARAGTHSPDLPGLAQASPALPRRYAGGSIPPVMHTHVSMSRGPWQAGRRRAQHTRAGRAAPRRSGLALRASGRKERLGQPCRTPRAPELNPLFRCDSKSRWSVQPWRWDENVFGSAASASRPCCVGCFVSLRPSSEPKSPSPAHYAV